MSKDKRMINSNNKQDRKIEVIKMSYFSEYEDLIRDINEDIEAGVLTADDWIKVVRKRKIKGDLRDMMIMKRRRKL